MADSVLITMDDLETAVRANAAFEAAGASTVMVSSVDDVGGVFRRTGPDVVVLTGALRERPATELIGMARERGVSTLGLIEDTATDPSGLASRIGLTDWLRKPVTDRDVVGAAQRLLERRRLQERTGIIGESRAIQEVLVRIEQLAPVSSTVLIQGESGTGKELVAQAIHDLSPRRDKPFIAINCSALPETLLESELFGHEKGSFTGAAERRLGRFELANDGTLFLDEVGDMPPATQVKLLRVLESRSFFRVGGSEPIRVDVRVVAATNKPLQTAVAEGQFREDLFFRLNVLTIYLPPLRERKGDIPILVRRFIRHFSREHQRTFKGITQPAMQILVDAHWPGNVRQLRNLIESMVVLAPGQEIDADDIPADVRDGGTRLLPIRVARDEREPGGPAEFGAKELQFIFRSLVDLKVEIEDLKRRMDEPRFSPRLEPIEVGESERSFPDFERAQAIELTDDEDGAAEAEPASVVFKPGMTMADVERAAIEGALADSGGNRRQAASRLGIGERTLYRKIKEYGLG